MVALQVKLTSGEQARMWYGSTRNLEAWEYAVKGIGPFYHYSKESLAKARELFERAIEIDPEYAHAITMLGFTHFLDARNGFTDSRDESLKRAVDLAKKAIELNDEDPLAHTLWAYIYLIRGEHDKAVEEGRKSIALGPNDAEVHSLFGSVLLLSGMFEESVYISEKAIRLHPNPPLYYLQIMAVAYRWVGRYDETLATTEQLIERCLKVKYFKGAISGYAISAVAYIKVGRDDDALGNIAKILKINPKYSLGDIKRTQFYKNPAHLQEIIDALRKAGLPEHPPLQLPDKPSIAVLPLKNISGDLEQEFLADGITESIIGTISRVSGLFVIASNSVFTYKGKAVKVQAVGRELGVQNILEGTVQKVGTRLRVSAQLIDAITGRHLWSEKYDRDMGDIFAIQDNISKEILTALQVKLVEGEQARVWARGTDNLDAYLKFLQAYDRFKIFNKENMILTRQICEEAIALDPKYGEPYTLFGTSHLINLWFAWAESPQYSMEKAMEYIQKGIALNPLSDFAFANLGHLYLLQKRYDEAVEAGEKAIELNPNGDYNIVLLALTFNFIRRYEEAITLLKEGQRRSPYGPAWYFHNLGSTYRNMGRWDEAIAEYKKTLKMYPNHFAAKAALAGVYGMAGRLDEGRSAAAEILKVNPRLSIESLSWPYKYKSDEEAVKDGFRKIGIPEKPPPK